MAQTLPRLTSNDQEVLLAVARHSIAVRVGGPPSPRPADPTPRLLQPQGAFVSLHRGEDLRGCVGVLLATRPLIEMVAACAAAAATEDPRFDPLVPDELSGLQIEISALDPPFRIVETSQILLGTHGLIVTQGRRHGLLLPQVASAYGWDVPTFLDETCRKAGLPPWAWRSGAVIEAFSAQVFSERDVSSY